MINSSLLDKINKNMKRIIQRFKNTFPTKDISSLLVPNKRIFMSKRCFLRKGINLNL